MAAIADFYSESISSTINQFLWTDNGEANTLKRAPNGGSYSAIATVTGSTTYQDTTVVAGTYYDYKITSGISGDSNVSSVVTQVCDDVGAPTTASLAGQYAQDQVTPTDFNNLVDDLNKQLQAENSQGFPCEVCPINGAVVLDCGQCSNFIVNCTTDINSISMVGCENIGDGSLNLLIPPGTTPSIGGFPSTLGFDGFEGKKNPGRLTGGVRGVSHRVPFGASSNSGAKRQVASKGKTGGTPKGLPLTLTCQTSVGGVNSNCSMACPTTKAMKVVTSGGTPPYTFSATGGLGVSASGSTATITPPANSSPGTAGVAYKLYITLTSSSSGSCFNNWISTAYGCGDTVVAGGTNGSCDPSDTCNNGGTLPGCASLGCLGGGSDSCTGGNLFCSPPPQPPGTRTNAFTAAHAPATISTGYACDKRTGSMISAGCVPCGVSVPTRVVTVRDSAGAQVSKTLAA